MPDDVGEWISILRKAANELLTLKANKDIANTIGKTNRRNLYLYIVK